jgi:hypothetical protein
MRARRLSIVVVVLLLVPTVARAHDHTADFFAGFCYAYDSNLFGVQQAMAITLPKQRPGAKRVSVVFDTSAHMGEHKGEDRTRVLILGGVRYTLTQLIDPHRHLLTAHFLAGGLRDGGMTRTSGDFATAFGGGYEYLQQRDDPRGLGFRLQFDYVVSGGADFPRISGGIVYRR